MNLLQLKFIMFCSLIFVNGTTFSQQITFAKLYPFDIIGSYDVTPTSDGGYVLAGGRQSDIYLIKTDAFGDTLWTKTFGTLDPEYAQVIMEDNDGNIVIGGSYYWEPWSMDFLSLHKTDSEGNLIWSRDTINGTRNGCSGIIQLPDGNYVIGGVGDNNGGMIMKTDTAGNTLWQKYYGPDPYSGISDIKLTVDSNIIFTATEGVAPSRHHLFKIDSSGSVLWEKIISDTVNGFASAVNLTNDGGYITSGSRGYFDGNGQFYHVYMVKTDSLGDTLWTNTFGSPPPRISGLQWSKLLSVVFLCLLIQALICG